MFFSHLQEMEGSKRLKNLPTKQLVVVKQNFNPQRDSKALKPGKHLDKKEKGQRKITKSLQLRPNLVEKKLDYFLFIFSLVLYFSPSFYLLSISFSIHLLDNFPSFHNFLLCGLSWKQNLLKQQNPFKAYVCFYVRVTLSLL